MEVNVDRKLEVLAINTDNFTATSAVMASPNVMAGVYLDLVATV